MNHPHEPLDPHGEALARALQAEAETVRPAGDGLVRIRARVERRRSRTRWVLPTASAATVAATVTAVVASGGFGTGKHSTHLGIGAASLTAATTPVIAVTTKAKRTAPAVAVPSAAASTATVRTETTALASPAAQTTTPAVTRSTVSAYNSSLVGPTPVWPFASTADAANWQKSATSSKDWHLSSVATATHFLDALKLTGLALADKPTVKGTDAIAEVTFQRASVDSVAPVPFVTVELSHWASDAKAPWGVVAATSHLLDVTAPQAGASVRGSFQVTYAAPGTTEGQFEAAVYPAGATTTALVRSAVTSPGIVALPPDAPAGSGYLVVTATSGGGSTPSVGSLAVVPVQLAAAVAPPKTYVALVGGKVEVLDAASGTLVRTLAPGTAGVGGVAVTDDGEWVYLATTNGVLRTPLDGSSAPTVVSPDPATQVAVAGKSGEQLVYTYVSPDGQGQHLTWKSSAGLGTIQISQSLPPEAETLAISPTGTQIASYVKTGMQGDLAMFALPTATALSQSTTPTECVATSCAGATYTPDGDLLYATSNGTTVTVHRQHAGKDQQLFQLNASLQVVNLDTDASGTEVLLTQPGGPGWRWDGTKATALPAGVTDASW